MCSVVVKPLELTICCLDIARIFSTRLCSNALLLYAFEWESNVTTCTHKQFNHTNTITQTRAHSSEHENPITFSLRRITVPIAWSHFIPPFFFLPCSSTIYFNIRVRVMNVNKWRQSHHILLCYRFIHSFINCFFFTNFLHFSDKYFILNFRFLKKSFD